VNEAEMKKLEGLKANNIGDNICEPDIDWLITQLETAQDSLPTAKVEIQEKQQHMDTYVEAIASKIAQLAAAKVEIEQLKVTHINQADAINRHYADLTAAKEEIAVLTFKVSNVITERDIAWQEIERLTSVVETQTECIVKEQSQLAAANLEIARINQVAEEELDEANGKIEKLRDVVERVIQIERQRSETTSLLLIAEASLPKL